MCWQQVPRLVLAAQVEQMEQIDKIVFTHAVLKEQLSCCLKLKVGVCFFSPCSGISGYIVESIASVLCSSPSQLMRAVCVLLCDSVHSARVLVSQRGVWRVFPL